MLLETFQPRRSALGGPCHGPFKLELPEDPVLGLRCSKRSQQHASDKHRRGPSTPRDQALCHEISLCCAPLRMTVLWGFSDAPRDYRNAARITIRTPKLRLDPCWQLSER